MNAIFAWLSRMERSKCQRFYTETLWTVRMKKKNNSIFFGLRMMGTFFFLFSSSLFLSSVPSFRRCYFGNGEYSRGEKKKMLPIELIEPEQRRENTPPMAGGEYITARAKITTALQFTVNEFGAEK